MKVSYSIAAILSTIICLLDLNYPASGQPHFWGAYVHASRIGNGIESIYGGGGHLLGGWAELKPYPADGEYNPLSPLIIHTDKDGLDSQPMFPMITNFSNTYNFRLREGTNTNSISVTSARIFEDHNFGAYMYFATFQSIVSSGAQHGMLFMYVNKDGTVSHHKIYMFPPGVSKAEITGTRPTFGHPRRFFVTGNIKQWENDLIFAVSTDVLGTVQWSASYDFVPVSSPLHGPGEKANDIIENLHNRGVHIVGGADFGTLMSTNPDGFILTVDSATGLPITTYTRRVDVGGFDEITSVNENWEPNKRNFIMSGHSRSPGERAWFMKLDSLCSAVTLSMVYTNLTRPQGYLYPFVVRQVFETNNTINAYVMGGSIYNNSSGGIKPNIDLFYMDISNTAPNIGQCSTAHYAHLLSGDFYDDNCRGIGYLTKPHTTPYLYGDLIAPSGASASFISNNVSPYGCSYYQDQLLQQSIPPTAPPFPSITTTRNILTFQPSDYLGLYTYYERSGCRPPEDEPPFMPPVEEMIASTSGRPSQQGNPSLGLEGVLSGEANITVHPNPVQDMLSIDVGDAAVSSVTILTVQYSVVGTAERSNNKTYTFNAGHLAPGVYLAALNTDAGKKIIRFVKQ